MPPDTASPYVRALGDRAAALHPELRRYFSALPEDCVGIGEGVFRVAGTRVGWLRPFLRPLERRGVLFAGWAHDVPFRITNRRVADRLLGEREFLLPDGSWTMRDSVTMNRSGRVVDVLGTPGIVAASFDVDVRDRALVLTSRVVGLRLGALRFRVPAAIAPVVRLIERFDDTAGEQHVELSIDMPVIGRIHEYSGRFRYRIEKSTA